MRVLLTCASAVLLALGWLWHEVRAPAGIAPSIQPSAEVARPRRAGPTSPSLASPAVAPAGDVPATPPGELPAPPGGVRAWSPTAAPVGGPDPFAPVVQIRTAEDTRAGLAD